MTLWIILAADEATKIIDSHQTTLNLVLIAALIVLVWALRSHTRTNGEMAKTLLTMNEELRASVKERHESEKERSELREETAQNKTEVNLLKAENARLRSDQRIQRDATEATTKTLTDELTQQKASLKRALDQIAAHERQSISDRAQSASDRVQIEELKQENSKLKTRVDSLENKNTELLIALTQSEKDKQDLSNEIDALRQRFNHQTQPVPELPVPDELAAGESAAPV